MIEIKQISASETWALRHQVMWTEKAFEYVILENENRGIHYGLFKDTQLISVISLFVDNNKGQFRKFATAIEFQGKGFGTQLLKHLIKECKRLKISELVCDARISAVDFYQRIGLSPSSKPFKKYDGDYIQMKIDL